MEKAEQAEIPKLTKGLTVMKWSASFQNHLHLIFGVRQVPLVYVLREDPVVPAICPAAGNGQAFAPEFGSLKDELIARASHTHVLYKNDNELVFHKMEIATRNTSYSASIKPFERNKDGRGAYLALISQHAGRDKWLTEISKNDCLVLHDLKWKGNGSYVLERHCAKHRDAYVQMQAASEHVTFQLPDEHTRVTYLLDSIETNDASLQAAIASVKQDEQPGGLRNDFERTVATLMAADPVAKKVATSGTKRTNANISDSQANSTDSTGANVSSLNLRSGKGPKTGVDLRYHKMSEYNKLTSEQKEELREWRKTPNGKAAMEAGKKKGNSGGDKASIAAAVEQQLAKRMKAIQQEQQDESQAEAYVMSVLKKLAGAGGEHVTFKPGDATTASNSATTASATSTKNTSLLRSILKSAKNASA
eukprot:scaffold9418_cov135-Cylindrotheca_fusiformis.AAC.1